jgi:hypothetical protein
LFWALLLSKNSVLIGVFEVCICSYRTFEVILFFQLPLLFCFCVIISFGLPHFVSCVYRAEAESGKWKAVLSERTKVRLERTGRFLPCTGDPTI